MTDWLIDHSPLLVVGFLAFCALSIALIVITA